MQAIVGKVSDAVAIASHRSTRAECVRSCSDDLSAHKASVWRCLWRDLAKPEQSGSAGSKVESQRSTGEKFETRKELESYTTETSSVSVMPDWWQDLPLASEVYAQANLPPYPCLP